MSDEPVTICGWCGKPLHPTDGCPDCTEEVKRRPDPATMTPGARVAEMERIAGPMWVPFSVLHKRIEDLVGRPVWTHEFAGRVNWMRLVEEARRRDPLDYADAADAAIALLPPDKTIVVTPGEE